MKMTAGDVSWLFPFQRSPLPSDCTGKLFSFKDKEEHHGICRLRTFPPAEMTQESFVRFVQEEVFPSVVMGPTSNGEITELHLLTTGAAEKYLWVIKAAWVVENEEGFVHYRTEDARQK